MTKTKSTFLFLIFFIAIGSAYLFFYDIPATDSTLKKEFTTFNSANINGVVEELGIKYHTTSFKLKGVQHEFIIYDIPDGKLNDNKPFDDVVSMGDSIIKFTNSDTLTVLHLEKAYRYTFKKFQ